MAVDGFGRLSEWDAHRIAELVGTFPARSRSLWLHMVLVCYSALYYPKKGEGMESVPYFVVGVRGLAKKAGCSNDAAARFLTLMEWNGVILRLGETVRRTKSGGGRFEKRAFAWHVYRETVGEQYIPMYRADWGKQDTPNALNSTPRPPTPGKTVHPCTGNPGESSTHTNTNIQWGAMAHPIEEGAHAPGIEDGGGVPWADW